MIYIYYIHYTNFKQEAKWKELKNVCLREKKRARESERESKKIKRQREWKSNKGNNSNWRSCLLSSWWDFHVQQDENVESKQQQQTKPLSMAKPLIYTHTRVCVRGKKRDIYRERERESVREWRVRLLCLYSVNKNTSELWHTQKSFPWLITGS